MSSFVDDSGYINGFNDKALFAVYYVCRCPSSQGTVLYNMKNKKGFPLKRIKNLENNIKKEYLGNIFESKYKLQDIVNGIYTNAPTRNKVNFFPFLNKPKDIKAYIGDLSQEYHRNEDKRLDHWGPASLKFQKVSGGFQGRFLHGF